MRALARWGWVVALALTLAVAPGCGDEEAAEGAEGKAEVDPNSLTSVATAILRGYVDKDVEVLSRHAPEVAKEHLSKLDKGSELYERVFDPKGWRMQTAVAWDGTIRAVRIDGERARVHYADLDTDRIGVVALRKVGEHWAFDDLRRVTSDGFAAWGEPEGGAEASPEGEASEEPPAPE